MSFARVFRASAFALLAAVAVAGAGCKQKTNTWVAAPTGPNAVVDVDADPAALLPYGSVLVANLDAKQITNGTLGGDVAALTERLVPFASQIDFQAKRDLDRVWIGMYSFSGADLLGVLSGSFHADKIEAAAQKGLNTPFGLVVASTYANRRIYTVANVGFTVLSDRTALVGSEAAMRRALDRIAAGTVKREFAPWMGDWANQSGYPVLVASDVTKQSFGKTVTGFLPWVNGVEYVRVRGRFNPDTSFGVSGALTYPDAQKAQQAASGFDSMKNSLAVLAMFKAIGIKPFVRTAIVNAAGNDMQFRMVLDEATMRQLLHLGTDWIGTGAPPPAIPTPPPAQPGATGSGTSI